MFKKVVLKNVLKKRVLKIVVKKWVLKRRATGPFSGRAGSFWSEIFSGRAVLTFFQGRAGPDCQAGLENLQHCFQAEVAFCGISHPPKKSQSYGEKSHGMFPKSLGIKFRKNPMEFKNLVSILLVKNLKSLNLEPGIL